MTAVIRQLLDFARPRAAVKAPTDLAQLCRRTLQFLESMAARRGIELRLRAADAVCAEVDAGQMEQVMTNLVVNAIQATPAGGSVELGVLRAEAVPPAEHGGGPGDYCRLDVRDTGSGIEAEHMRRLFEPFFTTKGVGEGTGLGLSVSRGIVRENGGWIEVRSTPGSGSCFSVFLPPSEHKHG
jgi:signal transduction histidine kinase